MTSYASPCLTSSPATSNGITMTVNTTLPASISIDASATTICDGTSVTFTTTPTNGGSEPGYQWQINGTDVSGETNNTFTTTTLADSDVVTVVMTSYAGPCATNSPATSNGITMTVNTNLPASVSIDSTDTIICAGTSVTFTATPTNEGTAPTYQWQVNATNVSGEVGATFTTTSLVDADVVSVIMTSNASPCVTGSPATSNTISMSVTPTATATISTATGPISCNGSDVEFIVTGTSGATITYNLNGDADTTATLTGGTTSIIVYGATSTQTLNLVSVDNGCSTSLGTSSTVSISTTTWDGTSWDNGDPTSASSVIFTGNYVIGSDFNACSITVTNGAIVSVASGFNVSTNGAITVDSGSYFTLENNANLFQSDATAINTGSIVVKRNSNPLKRLDYTMWSSPVAAQQLLAFSPLTSISPTVRFYNYNTSTNLYNSVVSPSSTNFAVGSGYLIRVPNNHPLTPNVWTGYFMGVPNNGTKTVTLNNIAAGQRYNLVGNPYPSPISIAQIAADNAANIEATMYFWRKTNGSSNPSYCTWNTASQTFGSNGEAFVDNPAGVIQTGQGFIVEAKASATSMQFNNGQRIADNTGQFFKSNPVATVGTPSEAHRIWLNMTGTGSQFSQVVVGYFSNATLGADDFDSKFLNYDGVIGLNTKIGAGNYVIQGRPTPFDASDIVPLNYKVTTAGNYTFAIDHVDGIFANGQTVYIKDNADGSYHNISTGSFTFATDAGEYYDRFEVVYLNSLLNTATTNFSASAIIVYHTQNEVVINTGAATMTSVRIFDIRGRLLLQKKDINASETKVNVGTTNEVLLVEVTTTEGLKATKRIIN